MGPRLQFYLEALQLFCTKCLGASVYPAAATLVDVTEYAHLHIIHLDVGYNVIFYTAANTTQCLRIHSLADKRVFIFKDLNALSEFLESRFDPTGVVNVGKAFKFIGQLLSFIAGEQQPFYFELLDLSRKTMTEFFDGVSYNALNPFAHIADLDGYGLVIGTKFRLDTESRTVYDVPFFMTLRFTRIASGFVNGICYSFEAGRHSEFFDFGVLSYPKALDIFTTNLYPDAYDKVLYTIGHYAIAQATKGGK